MSFGTSYLSAYFQSTKNQVRGLCVGGDMAILILVRSVANGHFTTDPKLLTENKTYRFPVNFGGGVGDDAGGIDKVFLGDGGVGEVVVFVEFENDREPGLDVVVFRHFDAVQRFHHCVL